MIGFLCAKTNGQNLNEHQWKNRVLIVKTLSTPSKKFNKQLNELKNSNKELKERKLVLYKINKDDFSLINFANSKSNYSAKVSESITQNILDEDKDFEIILIGLDGGVKLKQNEILLIEDLFGIIDSMPMRKKEMRD